jgi:hypothetical protein
LSEKPKSAAEPLLEKCTKKCIECIRVGCCHSCERQRGPVEYERSERLVERIGDPNQRCAEQLRIWSLPLDTVCFWCGHDFQPSVLHPDPERPLTAGKHRVKAGYPAFIDGKPCPYWKCGYYKDVMGNVFHC